MTDLTGTTLDNNYFLRQLIGGGATANVYLAWDKARSTQLAVKVLHEELAGDPNFQKMFQKEAEFMRELRHQNIVRLFDFGEDHRDWSRHKIVYIAMEYVKGQNLHGLLTERKIPLTLKETSQILAAVCKALNFAHRSKVLHCDVKPANILIDQSERTEITEKETFLADFGISHWALQQKGGGTPAYMAPELFRESPKVTEQTDIYALGVTLYEMLSGGQLPFRGETSSPGKTPRERIAWEKLNKPLPSLEQFNPDLPKPILSIVEKALNKDSKVRHKFVLDIWHEFESARSGIVDEKVPNSERKTIVQPLPPPPTRATPPEAVLTPRTAEARASQPHLFGISGEKAGQIIPVGQHEFMIGRHTSNKLRFEDRTVSRYHATILVTRQGYYIRDDNSSLGTFLNGRRISPNLPERMRNGDRIKIGQSQIFEFRLDARPRERP